MPIEHSAFLDYARRVSHKTGVFFTNTRRDAWEFHTSRDRVTRWIKDLQKAGWLVRLDRGPRKRHRDRTTGFYKPMKFQVLNHDEWVAIYGPKLCRFPPQDWSENAEPDDTESRNDESSKRTHETDLSTKQGQEQSREFSSPVLVSASPVLDLRSTCPDFDRPPVHKTRPYLESTSNSNNQQNREQAVKAKTSQHSDVDPNLSSNHGQVKVKSNTGEEALLAALLPQMKSDNGKPRVDDRGDGTCPECGGIIRNWIEHRCPMKATRSA